MGIKGGQVNVALVIISKAKGEILEKISNDLIKLLNFDRDDKVLEGNEDTLRKFGINETEVQTVTKEKYGNLILEKVAMVDIIK
jgi:tRNA threonylcarbamoyladenosine modification (KEOPS) complex Cgi121 subunit